MPLPDDYEIREHGRMVASFAFFADAAAELRANHPDGEMWAFDPDECRWRNVTAQARIPPVGYEVIPGTLSYSRIFGRRIAFMTIKPRGMDNDEGIPR